MSLARLSSVTEATEWLGERGVRRLTADSRAVAAGDAFIAWPGHATDGRRYVGQALTAGAAACLVEADGLDAFDFDTSQRGSVVAAVAGLKAMTGEIASAFCADPSRRLDVVAITGTNGKTSTAWWLAQALGALGRRCGVVGTLGVGEPGGELQRTGLTTPDPVTLQQTLAGFASDGFAACAIEASSIGIVEQRLAGTRLAVAVLTNFTQDHLDYHATMDAYWAAKAQLFQWPGLAAAVINLDDPRGAALAQRLLTEARLAVWSYAVGRPARIEAHQVAYRNGGLTFNVREGDSVAALETALIGDYNVANLLAVIAVLRALGHPLAAAAAACSRLTPVPGRMQRVGAGNADRAVPDVVVDYAHTPDALDKALRALQPFAAARGGALWCVFGCGGNRDAGKRPLMGAVAERAAQHVVVTSDNPRGESPAAITAQIVAGMRDPGCAAVIEDRRQAIEHALRRAAAADVVLIAGKGHEDYQEIAGQRRPFSDAAVAHAALQAVRS